MQKEPATIVAALTGLISAVVGLLVAYNINVTQQQQAAITGVVVAFSAVVVLVGPAIRNFVYSPDKVEKLVTQLTGDAGVAKQVVKNGGVVPASHVAPPVGGTVVEPPIELVGPRARG